MRYLRFVLIFVFAFFITASAQTNSSSTPSPTPQKDKARLELEANALGLAESAVSDASSLKLWENRALVFALAGDLIWETDQKRARVLFRNAVEELNAGNTVPKEKPKDYYSDYDYWLDFSPRHTVLLIIAAYDADWALTLLQETRPPDLQAALNQKALPQTTTINQQKTQTQKMSDEKNRYKIQRELELEQKFAAKAAEEDPQKAAKLIRESLKKGVSQAALGLVQKIYQKDEKLAKELLDEIFKKIMDTDFKDNNEIIYVVGGILREASREQPAKADEKTKTLKPDEKQIKDLANKLADYFLQNSKGENSWQLTSFVAILAKFVPEKAAQLKKLIPEDQQDYADYMALMSDTNAKPEKLIEEAEKFIAYQKYELYRAAADKIIAAGQGDKAREMFRNAADSKQRDDILKYIDEKLSAAALKENKTDEVQKILAKADSSSSKIKILVDLAINLENKKTEDDHEAALKMLEDAKKLVPDVPDSNEAAADILKLASGYAIVAPEKAFPLLTNLIEMTNDLLTAKSLIAKYNRRNFAFKQGELIFMTNIPISATTYGKELSSLATSDFSRTKGLIDFVRRDDARVLTKILLAQSIIKGKIIVEGAMNFNYESF